MVKPEKKPIEEWAADITFRDEQFGMFVDHERNVLEAYFPRRENIDKPGETINAMLDLHLHPQWPQFYRPITQESALRVIYAVVVADALHEVLESVKFSGVRPLNPHPSDEDAAWDLITDISQTVSKRLMGEYRAIE